jgi:hypothetical protein
MFKFFESCKNYNGWNSSQTNEEQDEELIEYTWKIFVHDQLDSIDVVAAEFEVDELGYMFRNKEEMGIAFFSRNVVKFVIQKAEVTAQ